MTTTIHVAIGNTDNRLTQQQWSGYYGAVDTTIRERVSHYNETIYGAWVSPSIAPYQNACWAFSLPTGDHEAREAMRARLRMLAAAFRQDSIAWSEAEVDFLPGRSS